MLSLQSLMVASLTLNTVNSIGQSLEMWSIAASEQSLLMSSAASRVLLVATVHKAKLQLDWCSLQVPLVASQQQVGQQRNATAEYGKQGQSQGQGHPEVPACEAWFGHVWQPIALRPICLHHMMSTFNSIAVARQRKVL